jgi:hypothetical protein
LPGSFFSRTDVSVDSISSTGSISVVMPTSSANEAIW